MANFDEFTDGVTALDQAHLDGLVTAQLSYLVSGGIPSAATGLGITQPATVVVINDGTQTKRVAAVSATVTCGAGAVAQDNYVDLAIGGTYTVSTVAAGSAAPSVASNAIRLYRATTNAGNTAVTFPVTTLANASPIGAGQPGGVAALDANGNIVQAPASGVRAYKATQMATDNSDWTRNNWVNTPGVPALSWTVQTGSKIHFHLSATLFLFSGATVAPSNTGTAFAVQFRVALTGALVTSVSLHGAYYYNSEHITVSGDGVWPGGGGGGAVTATLQHHTIDGTTRVDCNAGSSGDTDGVVLIAVEFN